MKVWQVFFLVVAASFLGIMLLVASRPKSVAAPGKTQTPNPVEYFINEVSGVQTSIILTGDVMIGRSVMTQSLKKNDPIYPFLKVKETLKNADIVFVNLENPVIGDCPLSDSGFKFCARPIMLEGLVASGVDVANIANNHTTNYGIEGFNETKKYLTDAGISYVGDGNLVIKENGGTKFGFLGFNYVSKKPTDSELKLVSESKKMVDVLIVAVHWGEEYKAEPNENQKAIADILTKNGADVVYGTHPHWIQPQGNVNGKIVYYSLGNFVFDQAWSEETKTGMVIKLQYKGTELKVNKAEKIYMREFAQPEFISPR